MFCHVHSVTKNKRVGSDFFKYKMYIKYLSLHCMYKKTISVLKNLVLFSCEGKPPGKRQRLDSNSHDNVQEQKSFIPSNSNVTEVMNILKPNIKQLVEDTNAVSYISLYG